MGIIVTLTEAEIVIAREFAKDVSKKNLDRGGTSSKRTTAEYSDNVYMGICAEIAWYKLVGEQWNRNSNFFSLYDYQDKAGRKYDIKCSANKDFFYVNINDADKKEKDGHYVIGAIRLNEFDYEFSSIMGIDRVRESLKNDKDPLNIYYCVRNTDSAEEILPYIIGEN